MGAFMPGLRKRCRKANGCLVSAFFFFGRVTHPAVLFAACRPIQATKLTGKLQAYQELWSMS
jgi:hypothetical protein